MRQDPLVWKVHKGVIEPGSFISDYLDFIAPYLDSVAQKVARLVEQNTPSRMDVDYGGPADPSKFNLEFFLIKYGEKIQMTFRQRIDNQTYILAERPVQL
ncbi:MAG: hypothetical protein U9O94_10940 [Nanoarchaeota archaeon]|nr:hypothetical protein [Nanoarchaeota archaeon]